MALSQKNWFLVILNREDVQHIVKQFWTFYQRNFFKQKGAFHPHKNELIRFKKKPIDRLQQSSLIIDQFNEGVWVRFNLNYDIRVSPPDQVYTFWVLILFELNLI